VEVVAAVRDLAGADAGPEAAPALGR